MSHGKTENETGTGGFITTSRAEGKSDQPGRTADMVKPTQTKSQQGLNPQPLTSWKVKWRQKDI